MPFTRVCRKPDFSGFRDSPDTPGPLVPVTGTMPGVLRVGVVPYVVAKENPLLWIFFCSLPSVADLSGYLVKAVSISLHSAAKATFSPLLTPSQRLTQNLNSAIAPALLGSEEYAASAVGL